ncbi:pleckstrin homology domain-containing protein 1-like [Silene latifolia]|uniref:pleckstrin homology domain-containing protein 1-like n=1 Tax=Silene latifolia TaxID=37657 RepID=UPI003D779B71
MDSLWQAISPASPSLRDYNDVEFWLNPEREGWLSKQGEFLKTWRRRWFVMKQGKLLWFKQPSDVTPIAVPRGVVHVGRCQVVKGAEDEIHKAHSFVVYIDGWPTYFVADSDKEKEEWVSSIGRVIVQHSGAGTPEIHNY